MSSTYLKFGLGNPWAGHNKAKFTPMSRSIVNIFDSVEKDGALDPTGSTLK